MPACVPEDSASGLPLPISILFFWNGTLFLKLELQFLFDSFIHRVLRSPSGLELYIKPRMALNSWISCLYLPFPGNTTKYNFFFSFSSFPTILPFHRCVWKKSLLKNAIIVYVDIFINKYLLNKVFIDQGWSGELQEIWEKKWNSSYTMLILIFGRKTCDNGNQLVYKTFWHMEQCPKQIQRQSKE